MGFSIPRVIFLLPQARDAFSRAIVTVSPVIITDSPAMLAVSREMRKNSREFFAIPRGVIHHRRIVRPAEGLFTRYREGE
ncbi:MAG: hypothetical protein LBI96_06920 [Odoribacteraceae bacterium]|nr:hypothetical protein [Odoribacteraceae bacterium]